MESHENIEHLSEFLQYYVQEIDRQLTGLSESSLEYARLRRVRNDIVDGNITAVWGPNEVRNIYDKNEADEIGSMILHSDIPRHAVILLTQDEIDQLGSLTVLLKDAGEPWEIEAESVKEGAYFVLSFEDLCGIRPEFTGINRIRLQSLLAVRSIGPFSSN